MKNYHWRQDNFLFFQQFAVSVVVWSLVLCNNSYWVACNDWDFGKCFVTEQKCPNKDVRFFLYTRETQDQPHELTLFEPETLAAKHFIKGVPLIILIHGYTGHRNFSPNTEIRPAYFKHGQYNIISVDYQPLAPVPCYVTAVKNLRTVANCTAQILDYLITSNTFTMANIHVIGFSLGGQTAGMVATYIKNGPLERITALDPAKPLFIFAPNEYKVDANDAKFVDVIHTDVFQRGILSPAGHLDFYVNGGVEQRGCSIQRVVDPGSCNHARAPEYYAESINSDIGFWGFRCPHWYLYAIGVCREEQADAFALMGMHANYTNRGLYFLVTNAESPYARGNNFTANQPMIHPDPSDIVEEIAEVDNRFVNKKQ